MTSRAEALRLPARLLRPVLCCALLAALAVSPGLAQSPVRTFASPGSRPGDGSFGYSMAAIGDLDGDALPDLVASAWRDGEDFSGRVYLFGGATGVVLDSLASPRPRGLGLFGFSVAGCGDLNGDGVQDPLVGALQEEDGAGGDGRVYLFSGADGEVLDSLVSPNASGGRRFGKAVSCVSDVDDDGVPDLLIGAPSEAGGGRAYVYSGATRALLHALVPPDPDQALYTGGSLAGVGDLDGDGVGDLLVGSELNDLGGETGREAYVFSGATGALIRTLPTGGVVAAPGDLDGDGLDELVVADYVEVITPGESGRVYVYSGATWDTLYTRVSPGMEGSLNDSYFGNAVAAVGDLNGDGASELLVGASNERILHSNGLAYLFNGRTGKQMTSLTGPPDFRAVSFGRFLTGAGDMTGDGVPDLLVADPDFESVEGRGQVYLFSGADFTRTTAAEEALPVRFALRPAYPNPFNPTTRLSFTLERSGPVRLAVYDLLGREVARLVDGVQPAGAHEVVFEAGYLPSGLYLARLTGGARETATPLLLAK